MCCYRQSPACCNKQRWDDHHGRPSQESHSRVFPFPQKQGLQSRPGNFNMGAVYLIKVTFTWVLKIIMLLSIFTLFCIPSLCDWFQMTCNLFSDIPYGPRHAKGVRTTWHVIWRKLHLKTTAQNGVRFWLLARGVQLMAKTFAQKDLGCLRSSRTFHLEPRCLFFIYR